MKIRVEKFHTSGKWQTTCEFEVHDYPGMKQPDSARREELLEQLNAVRVKAPDGTTYVCAGSDADAIGYPLLVRA